MSVSGYSVKDLQNILRVPRNVIRRFIAAGLVQPHMSGRALRFTFNDVRILRTAESMRRTGCPMREIVRAMRDMSKAPGAIASLAAIRLTTVGKDVAVRHADGVLSTPSGQLLLDFGPQPASGSVITLSDSSATRDDSKTEGYRLFTEAQQLDSEERWVEAENAYRRALKIDPTCVDAAINLGCLLSESGRHLDAVLVYERALEAGAQSPLLHFNMGVALEDAGDKRQALAAYERCIEDAPDFADAHFNAAALHEALGDKKRAIRHLSAYRALAPGSDST